jgi:hypothetical protein
MLPLTVHYRGLQFSKLSEIQNQNDRHLQTITFYLLHMHLKFAKSTNMTTKIFPKDFRNEVYQNNVEFRAHPKFKKKHSCTQKTLVESATFEKTKKLLRFLPITFLSPFLRIWNQHKILRFLIPHMDFVEERKKIGGSNLECICSKNCTFSDILQKVTAIILRLNSIEIPKKV